MHRAFVCDSPPESKPRLKHSLLCSSQAAHFAHTPTYQESASWRRATRRLSSTHLPQINLRAKTEIGGYFVHRRNHDSHCRSMNTRQVTLVAILVAQFFGPWPLVAQENQGRPLFSQRPMMCYAGPYVAMIPYASPQTLVVVPVGPDGIAPTQTISTTGYGVIGMKCATWGVELLVRENGADHLSRLPFRIEDGTVTQEPQEVIGWTIPKSNSSPMPLEITRMEDEYSQFGPRGLGDWFVRLPHARTPEHEYVVHFVSVEKRLPEELETTLRADLLERTFDGHVTRTVPLVRSRVFEGE